MALLATIGLTLVPTLSDRAYAQTDAEESWNSEIRPIFDSACLDCHSGDGAEGSLDLDLYQTVEQVVADRRLWKKLANRVRDHQMPPEDGPVLPAGQRNALLDWIDRKLPEIPCTHRHHAGSVTIRRLTRDEYANTIRELLQVDFQPADKFPVDESGYGFDNIGDVLSVSPLLLEKYLAAAEEISNQVIDDPNQHKVDVTTAASDLPVVRGSRILDTGQFLTTNGTLALPASVTRSGTYVIEVEAWAQQAGDELARLGVSADGQLLKSFDVTATRDEPQVLQLSADLESSTRNLGISFLNDFYNPDEPDRNRRDRNLAIRGIRISGPTDAARPSAEEQHFLFELPGPGQTAEQAAQKIIKLHGSRAWRRPIRKSEIDELLKIFRLGQEQQESFQASMQLVLQAMLVSPHFLYKVEYPVPDDGTPRRLNDYELATSISYFLWGSMPDNQLFQQAAAGALSNPQVVAGEVERLLQDKRSRWLVSGFGGQWLQLRVLESTDPDPDLFAGYDESLRAAMIRETHLLLNEVVREDAPPTTLLSARHTWLNRKLARHYGISTRGLRDREFRRVELDDHQRGGILTHGSVLTLTSNPTRTSPVKRGKWVLENLLADPPPPALPDVPQLDSQAELTGSLRQRMVQHRADPNCATCHYKMDSIGFALENFDAVGRFRTRDGDGLPVDVSGTLPGGQEFSGPRELQDLILEQNHGDFIRCFTEKLFTFAMGRGPIASDDCIIDSIASEAARENHPASWIIKSIIASEPFQYRSGPVFDDNWDTGQPPDIESASNKERP